MSLAGYFRLAERTPPLVVPAALGAATAAAFALAAAFTQTSVAFAEFSRPQLIGTVVMFALLPAYLLAMMSHLRRRTLAVLDDLGPLARREDVALVRARLDGPPGTAWLPGLLGFAFGATQNPEILHSVLCSLRFAPMDVAFATGACLVWAIIAVVLGWRLPTSLAMSRLGHHLALDLYRLDRVRSIGRLATTDILVIAGAMAFMPLQSLDAEFRAGNYEPGLLIGIPAAVAFFMTPLWGVHRRIRSLKSARLDTLRARFDTTERDDVAMLEALAAHLDRLAALPTWPIDLRLLTRLFAYGVIPPLAWIGAALVQTWVERL